MIPAFDERATELELMDDPNVPESELVESLQHLEVINRCLGHYAVTLEGLQQLIPPSWSQFSVLDVGGGSADVARRITTWARSRGQRASVTVIELSDTTVSLAKKASFQDPDISIQLQDLYKLPDTPEFDVVHAAQVLHHFPGEEAVRALRKMYTLSRLGVVVNDLHRHLLAWAGIRVLTGVFSRNRITRYDAPLSVRRAFLREELHAYARKAGLPPPWIAWRPMFRWLMVNSKLGPYDRAHP